MKAFHEYHTEPLILHNRIIDFEPHLHHEVEILVLFEGNACATVNGKEYPLSGGDLVIVFPGTVHSYRGGKNVDVGKFIFRTDLIPDLKTVFGSMIPKDPLLHSADPRCEDVRRLAADIIRHYRTSSSVVQKAYLSLLVGKILEACDLEPQKYAGHDTLDLILRYCQQHFREELSLQSLSTALGISKSHLSHLFSDKIKLDFRNYLNTLRVNYACPLLSGTDLSVTEIAEQSGFSSLRTFNRAFLLQHGVSPTAYKKQLHKTR